jgi:hypothetical protein
MIIIGIDKLGGSANSKTDTSWEDWSAEVLKQIGQFIKYEVKSEFGTSRVDVEASYRDCYDRGLTVADAFIEMY